MAKPDGYPRPLPAWQPNGTDDRSLREVEEHRYQHDLKNLKSSPRLRPGAVRVNVRATGAYCGPRTLESDS